ncbi:hypothetical protein AVEN_149561-1, partial [Araneus ventricosus]
RGVPGLVFLDPVVFKEIEFFLHRKSVEWTLLSRGVPGLVFLDPVVFKETEFFFIGRASRGIDSSDFA